jgi:hypothetical protein
MAAVGSRKVSRCKWGQPPSAVQPRSGERMQPTPQGVGLVPKAGEAPKGRKKPPSNATPTRIPFPIPTSNQM